MGSCGSFSEKNKYRISNTETSSHSSTTRSQTSQSQTSRSRANSRIYSNYRKEPFFHIKPELLIKENNSIPSSKYKIKYQIGQGSFGTVYLAHDFRGNEVAIKKLTKAEYNKIDNMELINEIEILKQLSHPNIMKIYEFFNTSSSYYLVCEIYKHGELYSEVNKKHLKETQISFIFYQILSALVYLHKKGITHRDLKLENIMITDSEEIEGTKYFYIKLIDFGASRIVDQHKVNGVDVVGTSYYMAPEVLKRKYSTQCDMWSAGVILYMLATGKAPFDGKDEEEIKKKVTKGKFDKSNPKFSSRSKELQDLICKLLETNPKKRYTAEQALSSKFFKISEPKKIYEKCDMNSIKEIIQNLLKFKTFSKFQQIVIAYLCHNIPSNKETKNITKLFFLLNQTGDGQMTKKEFVDGLICYCDAFLLEELFDILDGENLSFLTYEEFMRGCLSQKTILNEELLMQSFKFFANDNNYITIKAVHEKLFGSSREIDSVHLNKNSQEEEQNFISSLKSIIPENGINFEEFKRIIKSFYE